MKTLLVLLSAAVLGAQVHGDPVVKRVLAQDQWGTNLLLDDSWHPWGEGFEREGGHFVCANGTDDQIERGVSQTVELLQAHPIPIRAVAHSRAEGVGGSRDVDYSLYLDLIYMDGTPLWGQIDPFATGTHDWQQREVIVLPEKPVRSVSFHMLLRRHTGTARFQAPVLHQLVTPDDAVLFDGLPVQLSRPLTEGMQIRDVKEGSDIVLPIDGKALGLEVRLNESPRNGAVLKDIHVADVTGKDRAITLFYTVPLSGESCTWFADPRNSEAATADREYMAAGGFRAGANGRLSRYPFAAIQCGDRGIGIGIDMAAPAFFRVGLNMGTRELFLAYDLGLTPEKHEARVRFCTFEFDPEWGFRAALQKYVELFPEAFLCRVPEQGLWMPFARVSRVEGWEDFGFAFKEGSNEVSWDDAHNIATFRYTEPMTWWMPLEKGVPRTLEQALLTATALAKEPDLPNSKRPQALLTSGYRDAQGQYVAQLRNTPWCDGAVWSTNSMPAIRGEYTDFNLKWNAGLKQELYGADAEGVLDGEYIDSSEGYVTDELDLCRDHFAAADTPLTFSLAGRRPAIFRGLIAFEYIRAIESDMRALGKLTMANSTPSRLCWLAPMLDVMGTETDWNPGNTWRPMSDADMLYRRVLSGGKPFCFLMNTAFDQFGSDKVEKYMKRCLAYGMFPGFFSADASTGHYFARPELYNRDRPLFKTYVPLCRRVSEAGWQPVTGARSDNPAVYVERFGDRYLTVFNDGQQAETARITRDGPAPAASRELLSRRDLTWSSVAGDADGPLGARTSLLLGPEDVALIDLQPSQRP